MNHRFAHPGRAERGSILTLIAVSLVIVMAFVAFAVDVMRAFFAVRKLEFATESSALYAYGYLVDGDGEYRPQNARANILSALSKSYAPSNTVPVGPVAGSASESPIAIEDEDVVIASNPLDLSEQLLQVTIRRKDSNALKLFFMPILSANFTGGDSGANPSASTRTGPVMPLARTEEIIGQPASRIGAGVPHTTPEDSRFHDLIGFAALPIAISNDQFNKAASSGTKQLVYSVSLTRTSNPSAINGAFVNLAASGQSADFYYNNAKGDGAVADLIRQLSYFGKLPNPNELPPAAVEWGSNLDGFDINSSAFRSAMPRLISALSQIPTSRNYILPVVEHDPVFGQRNQVVGFARMKLLRAVDASGRRINLIFQIAESVPVRNMVCANSSATVPSMQVALFLPGSVPPFNARTYLPDIGGIALRPRSIALAPSLSPRPVHPQ